MLKQCELDREGGPFVILDIQSGLRVPHYFVLSPGSDHFRIEVSSRLRHGFLLENRGHRGKGGFKVFLYLHSPLNDFQNVVKLKPDFYFTNQKLDHLDVANVGNVVFRF